MSIYLIVQFIFSICASKYWTDVIQNAIGAALGSAAAIAISILIYWLSIKNSNLAEKKGRIKNEVNQLKAFKVMLERSIQTSDKLIEHIEKFITALKDYPNEFPMLTITSLGNFRRIIESITVEKNLATYIQYFPGENPVKEFTSILEIIDYLYDEFFELRKMVQRASVNHFDRLKQVSDKFDIADKLAIDYISDINNQNLLTQNVAAIKLNFSENRGESKNVDDIYKLYLVPMRELMKQVIEGDNMNNFIRDYTYTVTKCIEYYLTLGAGYEKFVIEMNGVEKTLKKNLALLRGLTEKIFKKDLDKV